MSITAIYWPNCLTVQLNILCFLQGKYGYILFFLKRRKKYCSSMKPDSSYRDLPNSFSVSVATQCYTRSYVFPLPRTHTRAHTLCISPEHFWPLLKLSVYTLILSVTLNQLLFARQRRKVTLFLLKFSVSNKTELFLVWESTIFPFIFIHIPSILLRSAVSILQP